MTRIFTLIATILLILNAQVNGQNYKKEYSDGVTEKDLIQAHGVPHYPIPPIYLTANAPVLPPSVDNSVHKYFRPVFGQTGWSCNQAGGIGYSFTYEINMLRDLPADTSINQYPTHFSYNFLNIGQYDFGISYFETWEILKVLGIPTVEEYGGMAPGGFTWWPSGYELYYSAMHNRVHDYYRITVKDEAGLTVLKHWLHDHLDGIQYGGLASYMIGSTGVILDSLPEGTPEEGKLIILAYGPYVGHNMTVVGYNDSIRYDINDDGQFTNHIDINNDGTIDLQDWEIGAFKIVNTWEQWGDEGFAYMMYRLAATPPEQGGVFNNDFFLVKAKENVEPLLTMKIGIKHTSRQRLKITPGVSTDLSNSFPDHIMELPFMNFNGGDIYMRGDTSEAGKFLEFGLDISPLLSYTQSGQEVKFFLSIEEYDPQNFDEGEISYVSIIDYTNGSEEIYSEQTPVEITNNGSTIVSIVHDPYFNQPDIVDTELPAFTAGETYNHQLSGTGGTAPYKFSLNIDYLQGGSSQDFPAANGTRLETTNYHDGYAMHILDFGFPYCDHVYDTVYLFVDGYMKFDTDHFAWPYIVDPYMNFRLETSLTPLATDLAFVTSANEGIFYEGNENYALFRWSARHYELYPSKINFALKLFPDGKIEFLYGDMACTENIDFLSGISNGDGRNFMKTNITDLLEIPENLMVEFIPLNAPQKLSVSEDGIISGIIDKDYIDYSIGISLEDNNRLFDNQVFNLSNNKISIEHSYLSGDDDVIEYGEEVRLGTSIHNTSNEAITGMSLQLSSDNSFITLIDSTETIGNIQPGASIDLDEICSFNICNLVTDQQPLVVYATYTSESKTYNYKIVERINAPDMVIHGVQVDDGQNGVLEPGEEAELVIALGNLGSADAFGIDAELVCDDPAINIINNMASFGDISTNEQMTQSFTVEVHELAPLGRKPLFEIQLSFEQEDMYLSTYFSLPIGKIPILIADLDPLRHSGPLFDSILNKMSVEYSMINFFPENLEDYHSVFICLGGYFNNYTLSGWEGDKLTEYLYGGGHLYLEGRSTWLDDSQTNVHWMFGHEVKDTAWYGFDTIAGIVGKETEGLSFKFIGQNAYCNYTLDAVEPANNWLYANNNTTFITTANNAGTYKTIASAVEFGLLEYTDQIFYSDSLLKTYLEFFGIKESTLNINDDSEKNSPVFKAYPNPSNTHFNIFVSINNKTYAEVSVFDIHGHHVKTLFEGVLHEGEHFLEWNNGNNNYVQIKPGIYFCVLKTNSFQEVTKLIYYK